VNAVISLQALRHPQKRNNNEKGGQNKIASEGLLLAGNVEKR